MEATTTTSTGHEFTVTGRSGKNSTWTVTAPWGARLRSTKSTRFVVVCWTADAPASLHIVCGSNTRSTCEKMAQRRSRRGLAWHIIDTVVAS